MSNREDHGYAIYKSPKVIFRILKHMDNVCGQYVCPYPSNSYIKQTKGELEMNSSI